MRKIYNHVGTRLLAELKQITNADGSRIYETPTGRKYPSVTTILQNYNKEALIAWRKRVGDEEANRISKRATTRGTKLHSLVETYLQNQDPILDNPLQKEMFTSIVPLLNDIDNIHIQEKKLFSHHLRLAGTVDCIAEHKGRLSVIDFKTSTRAKQKENIANYFMQCSAYAVMYEEQTKIPVDKIVIMIAVEDDDPQIFIEKRDNYIQHLIQYRNLYEKINTSFSVATAI